MLMPDMATPSPAIVPRAADAPAPAGARTDRRARALGVVAGVAALATSMVIFLHFRPLGHAVFEYPDLNVYREAGRRLLDGRDLYATAPRTLPFTYPPFAAVVSVGFAVLPRKVAGFGWFLANLAMLAFVLRVVFRPALDRVPRWAVPLAVLTLTAVMFWVRPVNDTVDWGQINLVLLAARARRRAGPHPVAPGHARRRGGGDQAGARHLRRLLRGHPPVARRRHGDRQH